MTFRTLQKELSRMTAEQLDQDMIVELEHSFHNIVGINVASGVGDYLYKDEIFFSIDSEPLSEKEEEEE